MDRRARVKRAGEATGEFEILDPSRTPTTSSVKARAAAQRQRSEAAAGCSPDQITPHNKHPAAFMGRQTNATIWIVLLPRSPAGIAKFPRKDGRSAARNVSHAHTREGIKPITHS